MFPCARITPWSLRPLAATARHLSTKTVGKHVVSRMPTKPVASSPIVQQVRTMRQNPFHRGRGPQHVGEQYAFSNTQPFQQGGANYGYNDFSARGGWPRVLASVGIVVGTAIGANLFFNREKRGALSAFESKYLNSTFLYLGLGLGCTFLSAFGLQRFGYASRIMFANPWLVLIGGLVFTIGGMMGAQALPPGHPGKVPCWLLFNFAQGAVLSPLLFLSPALVARAGMYTAGLMMSLCYVGATARDDKYLYLGGPLLAGVTIVALTSLAPLVLPVTMMRTLMVSEAICLYGGLALFGVFVLYDTQKVLQHARMVQAGMGRPDPLAESISFELDFINIFVRILQILAMRDQRRK